MQLRIYGKNTKVARYELRLATEIMLAHLLSSRMLPHISLYIRQKPHLTCVGEPSLGLLYGRNRRFPPRDFTIWLNTTYTRRIQLRTLGHELAHLKQYALGECRTLDNGTVKWHGRYMEESWSPLTPWEIEATGYEDALYYLYRASTRLSGRPGTAQRHRVRRVP